MAAVSDVSTTLDDLELNPVDDDDSGDNVTTTGNRKKELRSQIQKLKKSVAKGDKKKKKEISTEIARLEKELEELLQGQQPEQSEEMTIDPQRQAGKKSRAQKQRVRYDRWSYNADYGNS
jgi:paraquat-inducible protein B